MACLRRDQRTRHWTVGFRYNGREYKHSCRTTRKAVALRVLATVEETLEILHNRRPTMPNGADPRAWIIAGGKLDCATNQVRTNELRFGTLCDAYLEDQRRKADATLNAERTHIKHLKRILKTSARMASIDLGRLKQYAARREREQYHGKPIGSSTIRKELTTFRQIWVWGQRHGHVSGPCPLLGPDRRWEVELSKPVERMKFQTWAQIERRIRRGGLTPEQISELWGALFLDEDEVCDLLAFVRDYAAYPFVFPMFAFAAYTGARRSEILRSHIDDIDFQIDQVMLRERKRRKHLAGSTRFVPLHPRLRTVLEDWFSIQSGGQFTIACPATMPRREPKDGPQPS